MTRAATIWLVVAMLLAGTAVLDRSPSEAAYVRLQPTDKLMHAPRGDAAGVLRFAKAVDSYRIDDTRAYIDEIYRLAPLVGLDPAILIGQSALETGYWRGKFWVSDLNPAGIGITNDDQPTSFHWTTGTDAARGHIYHLFTYAAGVPPTDHILHQYRDLDPRVQNAVDAGYAGTKTTIQSLEGSWAVMSLYAVGLCNKANEILGYADDTAPAPTRTPTPSLRPLAGLASTGNDPRRALDGNLDTSWAVLGDGTPPRSGQVIFDLGEPIHLSSIRWVFRRTGYADYVSIRGSLDAASWTTLKVVGNAPAKQWQTLKTTATVRYVRLVFRNPNLDLSLGYLAEIAVYGSPAPTPTSTPTSTPTATATLPATVTATPLALAGSALVPVESGGSGGASPTHLIRDGDLATDWRTLSSPPPAGAIVYLDLGGTAALTGARWYLSQPGCGETLTIEASGDKRIWTVMATGDTTTAGRWQAVDFDATARYLAFRFRDPGTASALGCLAEAQAWGVEVSGAARVIAVEEARTTTPTVVASQTAAATATASVPVASPTADTPTPTLVPPTETATAPATLTLIPEPQTSTPTATPVPATATSSPTDAAVPETPIPSSL